MGLAAPNLVLVLMVATMPPASSAQNLAREMLAAHNVVRASVKAPALVWSDQLAAVAQGWANNLLKHKQFKHRPKLEYGENLYEVTNARTTPEQVVAAWTSESRNYDYASNSCRGVCGHYTQVVWRDAKEVGCAVARGSDREIWVCEYSPPGNWAGRRPW